MWFGYILVLVLGILIGIALNSGEDYIPPVDSDSGPWYECDDCGELLDDCDCYRRRNGYRYKYNNQKR